MKDQKTTSLKQLTGGSLTVATAWQTVGVGVLGTADRQTRDYRSNYRSISINNQVTSGLSQIWQGLLSHNDIDLQAFCFAKPYLQMKVLRRPPPSQINT